MKRKLLIISLLGCFIASSAHASLGPNNGLEISAPAKYAKSKQKKSISAQQAARIVKSKYGGKVLKVNASGSKNNPSYRVKLLKDNGHVISVNVDAKSGRVSGR